MAVVHLCQHCRHHLHRRHLPLQEPEVADANVHLRHDCRHAVVCLLRHLLHAVRPDHPRQLRRLSAIGIMHTALARQERHQGRRRSRQKYGPHKIRHHLINHRI